jgi:mevalonate kinase
MYNNESLNLPCTLISKSPGKIIISGEHAVVYNSKAIACSINLFTSCKIDILNKNYNKLNKNEITLNLINLGEKHSIKPDEILFNLQSNSIISIFKSFKDIDEYLISEDVNKIANQIELNLDHNKHISHFLFLFKIIYFYLMAVLNECHDQTFYFTNVQNFFKNHEIIIEIFSDIPHNAGLGSSAAYNVSLVESLSKLWLKIFDKITFFSDNQFKQIITILSFVGEKIFHAKPSGIDNLTSINRGLIMFQNFTSFSNLKSTFLSQYKIFLIDTKVRRETKSFIRRVTEFKTSFDQIFKNSLDSINYIVEEIKNIFENYEIENKIKNNNLNINDPFIKFSKLIELNQNLLQIIQVSNEEIEIIVQILKHKNIPAKLTGAGGGGFVVAFVTLENQKKFEEVRDKLNFPVVECEISF